MIRSTSSLTLLVLLFIGLNAVASAQKAYDRANLWEKEIAAFAEQDAKAFPRKTEVLFVGSSSIRGWRTVAEDFPKRRVLNRGFGGSHLEDVVHYAPQIVVPYKPKLIVFYAGENDLTAGKSVERVFDDYRQFVELVHKELPKTRIIFVSAKPSPSRWQLRDKFQQLNDLVRAGTEKDKRELCVDVWTPMLGPNGEPRPEIFQNDRLHMKPEGYKIWHDTLEPHINKGLKGNFR